MTVRPVTRQHWDNDDDDLKKNIQKRNIVLGNKIT